MSLRRLLSVAVLAVSTFAVAGCATDNPVAALSNLDATAPGAPTSLQADARQGALVLSWDASADADVAGYNVYRYSPDPARENSYVKVNSALVSGTEYTVTDATGEASWYRVKAVDTSANSSAASSAVEASAAPASIGNTMDPGDPGIERASRPR
ncbi:MAG: fibronectin type III domain-containing protein [Candidatus Eisenbacteria bacterium]